MAKKIETNFIKNLRKEYEDKINKAIQKEQEKLQKMNQEFLETLLELLLKNQKFENGFFELIEKNLDEKKRISIKKCYEKLKAEYS